MKITGVEAFPIDVPPPHKGGTVWLFLRLDTDTGIRGLGHNLDEEVARSLAPAA